MSRAGPDWSLVRAITRTVAAAPGGGMHRADLAAHFRLPLQGAAMRDALGVAYRQRHIDFVGQYVVAPGRRHEAPR